MPRAPGEPIREVRPRKISATSGPGVTRVTSVLRRAAAMAGGAVSAALVARLGLPALRGLVFLVFLALGRPAG
jgi:hypothetical protein